MASNPALSSLQNTLQSVMAAHGVKDMDFEEWVKNRGDQEYFREVYGKKLEAFQRDYGNVATVQTNNRNGACICVKVNARVFCINIEGDPVCCGVSYLYGFSIHDQFDVDLLKKLFAAILEWAPHHIGGARNGRYFINMIERDRYSKDTTKPPEKIEKPQMQYQLLYDFLNANCLKVNTTLCPNVNTGNIIHHMECLFKPAI